MRAHGGLQRAARPGSAERLDARGRADEDDARRVAGLEEGHRGVDRADAGHDVDVEHVGPALEALSAAHRAGVVDDDVESAERLSGVADELLDGVTVGHVGGGSVDGAERCQLGLCGANALFAAGADRDRGALLQEQLGDRPPDSAAPAGDVRFLPAQAEIHVALLAYVRRQYLLRATTVPPRRLDSVRDERSEPESG